MRCVITSIVYFMYKYVQVCISVCECELSVLMDSYINPPVMCCLLCIVPPLMPGGSSRVVLELTSFYVKPCTRLVVIALPEND